MLSVVEFVSSAVEEFSSHVAKHLIGCLGISVVEGYYDLAKGHSSSSCTKFPL
uniref:Uncharacterized protein n=1 Tax=Physcomitrium patens TaxID=3218 RepID=A0A2K1IVV6_PHYPA|nr:hypothetical protein PHYPA_025358 [Physcomitrium patens]